MLNNEEKTKKILDEITKIFQKYDKKNINDYIITIIKKEQVNNYPVIDKNDMGKFMVEMKNSIMEKIINTSYKDKTAILITIMELIFIELIKFNPMIKNDLFLHLERIMENLINFEIS